MGSKYSILKSGKETWAQEHILDFGNEKKTWTEHTIKFDNDARLENMNILKNTFTDGDELKLCYVGSKWGKFTFQHWFVTNGETDLEFGEPNQNIYSAQVKFNFKLQSNYHKEQTFRMDNRIRQRIEHVLGMCNYSLCLRNSEHVANYICRGVWTSNQTNENGAIEHWFPSYIGCGLKQNKFMTMKESGTINSFPSEIRAHVFGSEKETIYSESLFEQLSIKPFKATSFQYYLDTNEDTYNILVIGPTGAGKSHLINVLFNQKICHTDAANLCSVTKDVYFIRGQAEFQNPRTKLCFPGNIVVADTVGFCDTEWSDERVLNLIRNRVSSNLCSIDSVLIVFNVQQRLENQHVSNIKKMLDWLKYRTRDNFIKFCFIGTHGDGLDENEMSNVVSQASEILDLYKVNKGLDNIENVFVTSFPNKNEIYTNEQRDAVMKSFKLLRLGIKSSEHADRLDISLNNCSIS